MCCDPATNAAEVVTRNTDVRSPVFGRNAAPDECCRVMADESRGRRNVECGTTTFQGCQAEPRADVYAVKHPLISRSEELPKSDSRRQGFGSAKRACGVEAATSGAHRSSIDPRKAFGEVLWATDHT